MIIPEKLILFAQEWRVELTDELDYSHGCRGQCHPRYQLIKIQRPGPNYPRSRSQLEQTFLHELTHAILGEMDYEPKEKDPNDDEHFVDTFSNLLHQAIATGTGDLLEGLELR